MRSTGTRPAPSSACGANVSHSSRAPVFAWTRPAASSPAPCSAVPRSSSAVFLPLASRRAAASMASLATGAGPMVRQRAGGMIRRVPGRVRREDQRGNAARRSPRRLDGARGVTRDRAGALRLADPRRDRAGEADDVGRQQRVVLQVVGRVIADDVDDRRRRAPRVVQVGEAVGESRAEVQQRDRRLAGHAPVTVRGAGHHALEQAQHRAHAAHRVQRGDEVHFRGARDWRSRPRRRS